MIRFLGGLACWLCGCDRPDAAVVPETPRAELRFPVILVWTDSTVQIKSAVNGLKTMHVNYVTGSHPQPVVIDSDLKIHDMNGLHTTKSGLGLMLNPNGTVPIEFQLTPHARQGLDAARQLIRSCNWLGGDSDEVENKRDAIGEATSLEQMIAILQGGKD